MKRATQTVQACLTVVFLAAAAGCGAGAAPTASRPAVSHVVKAMLVFQVAAVPYSQVPLNSSLSGTAKTQLVSQEKAALSRIYRPHGTGYHKNLAAYQRALSQIGRQRRLNPAVSAFHLVSVTQSGVSASVEWTASLRFDTVAKSSSSGKWGTPQPQRRQVEGTTVLAAWGKRWRVSSDAGSAIP